MPPTLLPAREPQHFRSTARLHAAGITEGFLSSLGDRFLTTLYKGIAAADNSDVLIAEEDGIVLGFISYTGDVRACYRQILRRHSLALMWAFLPNFVRISVYRKVAETLLYPRRHQGETGQEESSASPSRRAELLSMAVGEKARGKGVGKLLVKAVDQEIVRLGLSGYFVVTHGVDERSNGFYQSCGFALRQKFFSHGKPMNEYFKRFGHDLVDP